MARTTNHGRRNARAPPMRHVRKMGEKSAQITTRILVPAVGDGSRGLSGGRGAGLIG